MNKELIQIIKKLSAQFGIEDAALASFIKEKTPRNFGKDLLMEELPLVLLE